MKTTTHDGTIPPTETSAFAKRHRSGKTTDSSLKSVDGDKQPCKRQKVDASSLTDDKKKELEGENITFDHDDMLCSIKTQHFVELFAMMYHGYLASEVRGTRRNTANKIVYGLYMGMNRVWITSLQTQNLTSEYPRDTWRFFEDIVKGKKDAWNKQDPPKYLKMNAFPYLNIFKPSHLKVLLAFLKFLFFHEYKNIVLE